MKILPILVMVILYQWYHHDLDGQRVTDASFKLHGELHAEKYSKVFL